MPSPPFATSGLAKIPSEGAAELQGPRLGIVSLGASQSTNLPSYLVIMELFLGNSPDAGAGRGFFGLVATWDKTRVRSF